MEKVLFTLSHIKIHLQSFSYKDVRTIIEVSLNIYLKLSSFLLFYYLRLNLFEVFNSLLPFPISSHLSSKRSTFNWGIYQ